MNQTIVALATPAGKSGVAILRISGKNASEISKLFHVKQFLLPRVAKYVDLLHPKTQNLIDQVILLFFSAPNSFTGEDVLEIHCHGSKAVIGEIVEILLESKLLRYAEAGEFTKRALENGKMDLVQAEALMDLIDSETIAQRDLALRQMGGETSRKFEALEKIIIEARAFAEVHLDFPDDDIPHDIEHQANARIQQCVVQVDELLSNARAGKAIRDGVKVAIIGVPNAGKSTLLNAIAQKKVAITSDVAGTTRDAISHYKEIDGIIYCFYDTAGVRESDDTIEAEGVQITKEVALEADLQLLVVDLSQNIAEQVGIMAQIVSRETIVVFNKIDLVDKCAVESALAFLDNFKIVSRETICISMIDSSSPQKIIEAIKRQKYIVNTQQIYVTRERHILHLQDCSQNLLSAIDSDDLIIKSQYLIYACEDVGAILGKISVEKVLDELFANFCIGK